MLRTTFLFSLAIFVVGCSSSPKDAPQNSVLGVWKKTDNKLFLHVANDFLESAKPGAAKWADKSVMKIDGNRLVISAESEVIVDFALSSEGQALNLKYKDGGQQISEDYTRATEGDRNSHPPVTE